MVVDWKVDFPFRPHGHFDPLGFASQLGVEQVQKEDETKLTISPTSSVSRGRFTTAQAND